MKKDEKMTFTKSILSIVVLLYFIGALLGGILVVAAAIVNWKLSMPIDSQMFVAYAAYLGAPTATAIAFYAWKSKCENLLKIEYGRQQYQSSEVPDQVSMDTLANMNGGHY